MLNDGTRHLEDDATFEHCPECHRLGAISMLALFKINFDEAVLMCTAKNCSFPFHEDTLLLSCITQHKRAVSCGRGKFFDLSADHKLPYIDESDELDVQHLLENKLIDRDEPFNTLETKPFSPQAIADVANDAFESFLESSLSNTNGSNEETEETIIANNSFHLELLENFLDEQSENNAKTFHNIVKSTAVESENSDFANDIDAPLVSKFSSNTEFLNSHNAKSDEEVENSGIAFSSSLNTRKGHGVVLHEHSETKAANSAHEINKYLRSPVKEHDLLQWCNDKNFCWLDVLLKLMVHSAWTRTVLNCKELLNNAPSVMFRLCEKYDAVQSQYQQLKNLNISLEEKKHELKCMQKQLNEERMNVFNLLKTSCSLKLGSFESVVEMLPNLLKLDPVINDVFTVCYRWEMQCKVCGYKSLRRHSSNIISFPFTMADFHPLNAKYSKSCQKCKAENQIVYMTPEKLPPCLVMHFQRGLPHNIFQMLDFGIQGRLYTIVAVIQYITCPCKHFVAWIRDNKKHTWICFDDLKHIECSWTSKYPSIPPNQIHTILWEKSSLNQSDIQAQLEPLTVEMPLLFEPYPEEVFHPETVIVSSDDEEVENTLDFEARETTLISSCEAKPIPSQESHNVIDNDTKRGMNPNTVVENSRGVLDVSSNCENAEANSLSSEFDACSETSFTNNESLLYGRPIIASQSETSRMFVGGFKEPEIDSEKSKTAPNGKENLAKAHTVTASLSDVPPVIRNLPDVGDGKNSPCTSSQMSDDTAFVDVLHKNKLEDESQSVITVKEKSVTFEIVDEDLSSSFSPVTIAQSFSDDESNSSNEVKPTTLLEDDLYLSDSDSESDIHLACLRPVDEDDVIHDQSTSAAEMNSNIPDQNLSKLSSSAGDREPFSIPSSWVRSFLQPVVVLEDCIKYDTATQQTFIDSKPDDRSDAGSNESECHQKTTDSADRLDISHAKSDQTSSVLPTSRGESYSQDQRDKLDVESDSDVDAPISKRTRRSKIRAKASKLSKLYENSDQMSSNSGSSWFQNSLKSKLADRVLPSSFNDISLPSVINEDLENESVSDLGNLAKPLCSLYRLTDQNQPTQLSVMPLKVTDSPITLDGMIVGKKQTECAPEASPNDSVSDNEDEEFSSSESDVSDETEEWLPPAAKRRKMNFDYLYAPPSRRVVGFLNIIHKTQSVSKKLLGSESNFETYEQNRKSSERQIRTMGSDLLSAKNGNSDVLDRKISWSSDFSRITRDDADSGCGDCSSVTSSVVTDSQSSFSRAPAVLTVATAAPSTTSSSSNPKFSVFRPFPADTDSSTEDLETWLESIVSSPSRSQ